MIIVQTPLRISFFGGGTDYPEFFLKEHGAVLDRYREARRRCEDTDRKLVQQVDSETSELEPEFEVFALEVLEPFAAEMAINRLFGPDGFSTTHEPLVDSDEDSRQLFVRADRKQLDQIRALLVKMGETHLAVAGDKNKRRMRVICTTSLPEGWMVLGTTRNGALALTLPLVATSRRGPSRSRGKTIRSVRCVRLSAWSRTSRCSLSWRWAKR